MKKRLLRTTMAIVTLLSATACGGTQFNDGIGNVEEGLEISIVPYDGGIGSEWLVACAERFAELKKDEVYKEGTRGVYFKIDPAMSGIGNLESSGTNIFFNEAGVDVRALSQSGSLLDISDVIEQPLTEYGESESIQDKLDDDYEVTLKGADGNYYGLPYYEWTPGLVYDVELFDKYGFYFAAEGETNVKTFESKYGTVNFVKANSDAKKTVGNDGIENTADDGLPTTLQEFLYLCAYMKSESVSPVQLSGMYNKYSTYFVEAFWTALAGWEQMRTNYDFDGDIEIVTGYTDENLFEGIDYVKVPVTKEVTVSETQNTDAFNSTVSRYYATAMLEIIYREGWFTTDASTQSVSHTDAQRNFINGSQQNRPMGMMIEGSYWYQESDRLGYFEDYYSYTGATERKLAWMSLPTHLNEVVTGADNAREVAMLETAHAYAIVNANIKNDAGLVRACKEFLRFVYTDAELSAFTAVTGTAMCAVDYEVEGTASLGTFKNSVLNAKKTGNIVYSGSTSPLFFEKASSVELNIGASVFKPIVGTQYSNYLQAIKAGKSAQQIFDATKGTSVDSEIA